MKYIQWIPILAVVLLNLWAPSVWATDSTKVLLRNSNVMNYGPSDTPPTSTVTIAPSSSTTAPSNAVCPAGYTLTSLNYTNSSGAYSYENIYQPTGGSCTSSSTYTNWGNGSSPPGCNAGDTWLMSNSACDNVCNASGLYCGGGYGYYCMYITCKRCTGYGGAWVSSGSVLPKGANSSTSNLIGFKEAICTDYRPVWH